MLQELLKNEYIVLLFVFSLIFILLYSFSIFISNRFSKLNAKNKKSKIKGYVYIISNPSFKENIYKIGMTERSVLTRIKELFTTGVPTPFVIEMKVAHNNPKKLEDYLHLKFAKFRINSRREFFRLPLKKIESEIKSLDLKIIYS